MESQSTDEPPHNETLPPATILSTAPKRRGYPIEIALAAMFIAWNLSEPVFTNQLAYQTCTVTLNFNDTDCKLLGTQNQTQEIKDLETKTQPYTANIQMAKSMIENIIPAILSLFIGPWSDKYGRKPVIMWPAFGFTLLYGANAIISYISTYIALSPWYYLIGSFFVAFSGGNCALLTGMFAFVADITILSTRDFRMGILEGAIYGGLFIGSFSSGYVLHWTSSSTVFGISSALLLFCFLFIVFAVQESLKQNEMTARSASKYRELFRTDLIIDLFRICFKRRINYDRALTWMLIGVLVSSIFVLEGSATIYFLYFREKLGWTISNYTIFSAWSIVIQFVGVLLSAVFLRMGVTGSVLALLGYISYVVGAILFSVATTTELLYITLLITFMKAVATPMIRSLISKIVDANDVGKVFSLTTSLESLTPLASAPLYTTLYKNTLTTFPGAFFVLSACIYGVCVVVISAVIIIRRRTSTVVTYVSINES